MFRFGFNNREPSWFYFSTDRCHAWKGPFSLPGFGQCGISTRTDYQIIDSNSLLIFASSAKSKGGEGRPFVARADDGALTWKFVSWIGPEPEGYAIMPSTVRLSPSKLVTALRRKEKGAAWIETYRSNDNGRTWDYDGRAIPSTGVGSNPAAMIRLTDGRLCLTYGYRGTPYGIRAVEQ